MNPSTICSCCGKKIKNNLAIHIAAKDSPDMDILICKSCIDEMHIFLNDREKERNEFIAEQKKIVKQELDTFVITLKALFDDYIKVLNDNINGKISYSESKKYLNKLSNNNYNDSIVSFFNSIVSISIDTIFEKVDYVDLPIDKYLTSLSKLFLARMNDIKCSVKSNDFAEQFDIKHGNNYSPDEEDEDEDEEDFYHEGEFALLTEDIDTPSKIKKYLDKYVIGQEKAKKIISVGIYNHYKRIEQDKLNIKKSNILLTGPTGCGKTEIARTIAKMLNVPFAIADATSMTSAGYVGDDVEDMLLKLIDAADGDVEWAEYGIIYIDEIDKLARNGGIIGRDVGGEGVQQALLKIVEGNDITISTRTPSNPMGANITINTENILFIAGGAFEDITMTEKPERVGLGFNATYEEEISKDNIDSKALIKYGIIPELAGRFPIIATLNTLSQDDLRRILVEPENSIVKQYQELLSINDIKLNFTAAALDWIAKKAFENKTGARGLKTIIEDSMLDVMYDLPDTKNIKQVQVGIKNNTIDFRKK